jgi:hypothetical protein
MIPDLPLRLYRGWLASALVGRTEIFHGVGRR